MLTPKKKQFVKEYLLDLNATQAAIRSGYSQRTAKAQGSRLLTDVDIQSQLAKAQQERTKRTEINADYVLTNLRDIVEMFKVENPGASLKGLELLGKNLKLFTDRIEIRVIKGIDDLTDEEQAALLADLESRQGK